MQDMTLYHCNKHLVVVLWESSFNVQFMFQVLMCSLFWLRSALNYNLYKTSNFRPCGRDNYSGIGKKPTTYFDESNTDKLLYHNIKQMFLLPLQGESPYPGMRSTEVPDKVTNGYRLPKPEYCPEFVWVLQYYPDYVCTSTEQVCLSLFIMNCPEYVKVFYLPSAKLTLKLLVWVGGSLTVAVA